MVSEADVKKLIAQKLWGPFFDALDVNGNGYLSLQEAWKWEKIGNSEELLAALHKFDVRDDERHRGIFLTQSVEKENVSL